MRSPPPRSIPAPSKQSPAAQDEDISSTASSSSHVTKSSRVSHLHKQAAFSSFGFGSEANVRVVCKIRNVDAQKASACRNNKQSSVYIAKEQTCIDSQVSFLSPTRAIGKDSPIKHSPSPSTGKVSNLTAKFNSPRNTPLMPSTDACVIPVVPTTIFSPSQAATPLRTNGHVAPGNIRPVRQSFLHTPTPTKEIEEKIEKKFAAQYQSSQTVIAGCERFNFDAVSVSFIFSFMLILLCIFKVLQIMCYL